MLAQPSGERRHTDGRPMLAGIAIHREFVVVEDEVGERADELAGDRGIAYRIIGTEAAQSAGGNEFRLAATRLRDGPTGTSG